MKTHAEHIGESFAEVGKQIEQAFEFEGKRGHFVLLSWVDGVIQCVANTPRDGVIDVLGTYIEVLMEDKMQDGIYKKEDIKVDS